METALMLTEIIVKAILVVVFISFVVGVSMKFAAIEDVLKDLKKGREFAKTFFSELVKTTCHECGTRTDGRNVVIDAHYSGTSPEEKLYYCELHKKPYTLINSVPDPANKGGFMLAYLRRRDDPLHLWERVTQYGEPYGFDNFFGDIKASPVKICGVETVGRTSTSDMSAPERECCMRDEPAAKGQPEKPWDWPQRAINWLDLLDPGDPWARMDPIILHHPRGNIVCEITLTGDLGTKKVRHNTAASLATKLGNQIINHVDHALLLEEAALHAEAHQAYAVDASLLTGAP